MSNQERIVLAAVAATLLWSFAGAQQPQRPPAQGPAQNRPATLEDRVAKLERDVASLSTRFEARDAALNRGVNVGSSSAFVQLQNDVNRLSNDVQRVAREADAATRAATDAQRGAADAQRAAMQAEREARDASLRH